MNLKFHGADLELERLGQPWTRQSNEETEGINNQRKCKVDRQGMMGSDKGRRDFVKGSEVALSVNAVLVPSELSVLLLIDLL